MLRKYKEHHYSMNQKKLTKTYLKNNMTVKSNLCQEIQFLYKRKKNVNRKYA